MAVAADRGTKTTGAKKNTTPLMTLGVPPDPPGNFAATSVLYGPNMHNTTKTPIPQYYQSIVNPPAPSVGMNYDFVKPPPAPGAPPTDAEILAAQLAGSYNPGSPGYSTGGGSSLVQTGPGLQQIISMLGLNNYTPPTLADLQKQANAQTDTVLNPQIDAVKNLIDQLNASTANQVNQEHALGARQRSDIEDTFNRLKAFTDASTAAGLGRFDQATQSVDAGNQQLLNAITRNGANARQAVDSELSRLGLGGNGSTLDTSRLDQDSNFLLGLADANRTNAANNLAQQRANYGGVQALLSQGQQQAGVAADNRVINQIADAISGIKQQQTQGLQGFDSQIQSLEAQRAAQNLSNLAALQQAVQEAQAKQQALMLQAISTANSGMKTVSNPSTHVGATKATGMSPSDYLKFLASDSNSKNSQNNSDRNYNLSLAKFMQTLGSTPDQLKSILSGS